MYTLKGELKVISSVQQVSDSFKKREFVVVDPSGCILTFFQPPRQLLRT